MGRAGRVSDFTDVDRAARPDSLVSYLDMTRALAGVHAYKGQAMALLDLHVGDRVLDAGCGTGEDVRTLAATVGPSGRAIGVDRSAKMIAAARQRTMQTQSTVEFRVADARGLPFPDEAFDACRADRVLQHIENPLAALAEIVRVLRRGGRIVVSEPDWDALLIDAPDRQATRRIVDLRAERLVNPYLGRRLPALLHRLGLEGIVIVPVTSVIERFEIADELLGLGEMAREATDRGLISAARAADWLDYLQAAGRAETFFASLTIFVVKGCKDHEGKE
jgi:ubiquinone/menaquinone biosynthesis C-methylase UbiE